MFVVRYNDDDDCIHACINCMSDFAPILNGSISLPLCIKKCLICRPCFQQIVTYLECLPNKNQPSDRYKYIQSHIRPSMKCWRCHHPIIDGTYVCSYTQAFTITGQGHIALPGFSAEISENSPQFRTQAKLGTAHAFGIAPKMSNL